MPPIRLLLLGEEKESVQTLFEGIRIRSLDADCVFCGESTLTILMDSSLVLA